MSQDQRKRMIEALAAAWEKHPDQRLGQLVTNVAAPSEPCPGVFHVSDMELMARLGDPDGIKPRVESGADEAGIQYVGLEHPGGDAMFKVSVNEVEGTVFISRDFWDAVGRLWDEELAKSK